MIANISKGVFIATDLDFANGLKTQLHVGSVKVNTLREAILLWDKKNPHDRIPDYRLFPQTWATTNFVEELASYENEYSCIKIVAEVQILLTTISINYHVYMNSILNRTWKPFAKCSKFSEAQLAAKNILEFTKAS